MPEADPAVKSPQSPHSVVPTRVAQLRERELVLTLKVNQYQQIFLLGSFHPLGEDSWVDCECVMKVEYATAALSRQCTQDSEEMWGRLRANKIRQRLAELAAAPNVAILMTLPALRCRALNGTRQGQFAIDALAPYLLVFSPIPTTRATMHEDPHDIRTILLLEVTMNV
jgi:plasmid maintenance system killer protein